NLFILYSESHMVNRARSANAGRLVRRFDKVDRRRSGQSPRYITVPVTFLAGQFIAKYFGEDGRGIGNTSQGKRRTVKPPDSNVLSNLLRDPRLPVVRLPWFNEE